MGTAGGRETGEETPNCARSGSCPLTTSIGHSSSVGTELSVCWFVLIKLVTPGYVKFGLWGLVDSEYEREMRLLACGCNM